MKYVTGGKGYIGRAFVASGWGNLDCDVTDEGSVNRAIAKYKPDFVLHLAAISDPDECEMHEDRSFRVNVVGTRTLSEACVKNKIPVVLLSSADVWGGGWRDLFNRHKETSRLTPAVNLYGMQKVVAENTMNLDEWKGAKIIRTSHVFNRERLCHKLSDLAHGEPVDAPVFLKRSFLHLTDFMLQIEYYCSRFDNMPPLLHLAGSKTVSYNQFWLEVCDQLNFDWRLVRGRRIEKNIFPAKRPHNGGLDVSLSASLGFPQFDYIGGIGRMKNEN